MRYLLDSSAWLAHLFGEPGADQVTGLFDDPKVQVSISALSIPEVYARLKSLDRQDRWLEVWGLYADLFHSVIPAGEEIAHTAVKIRAATAERLPTIDALIAATAMDGGLTLVHRDPHFSAVTHPELQQMLLPGS